LILGKAAETLLVEMSKGIFGRRVALFGGEAEEARSSQPVAAGARCDRCLSKIDAARSTTSKVPDRVKANAFTRHLQGEERMMDPVDELVQTASTSSSTW